MKRLKDDVMKLSKAEQYEIYAAIESNLFGERSHRSSSKQQVSFINRRVNMVAAAKGAYMNPEQLRRELDNMIG